MNQYTQAYAKAQIKGDTKPAPRARWHYSFLKQEDPTWIAKGKVIPVAEFRNNRTAYARPNKTYGVQWLFEVYPEVITRILAGEVLNYNNASKLGYYKYLVSRLNPAVNDNGVPNHKGAKRVLNLIHDSVRLCKSIKKEGLRAPVDVFMDGNHPVLVRGSRRIEILYQLGVENVPVRIWRNEWLGTRFIPSAEWGNDSGITGAAVKQFVKFKEESTDKYWIHNYIPYYEMYIGHRVSKPLRILELGIRKGMSLRLWHDAFTKAEIFGIDIRPERVWESLTKSKRITCIEGDENDTAFLERVAKDHGPFDMIVDDALHLPKPQRHCFKTLWPHVKSGGLYVCEDLNYNYKKKYSDISIIPDLTAMVDNIGTDHSVKSVNFHPNICFIGRA